MRDNSSRKMSVNTSLYMYPMPTSIVGVNIENKPNFIAVGWVSRCNANPPMLFVGINKRQYTTKGIIENESFSVNTSKIDLIKRTDYTCAGIM